MQMWKNWHKHIEEQITRFGEYVIYLKIPIYKGKSCHLMLSTLGLQYMVVLPQSESLGLPLPTCLSAKPVEPVESLAGMFMHNYNDSIWAKYPYYILVHMLKYLICIIISGH